MTPPRALIAPDSWKGSFSAVEVADALARGFEAAGWSADRCPLADGGEGTIEVLLEQQTGRRLRAAAHDPLGRPIGAEFGVFDDPPLAVVEAAGASGLPLVAEAERDAERASTFGTGELITAAARVADLVVVAVGGTASTDGGAGALEAIEGAGGLGATRLICICDVGTPWERAAAVFAPQKGADADAVGRLARRLDAMAAGLGRDPRGRAMTGAGGGLAGGLWGALGAELRPGADWVLEAVGFEERLHRASLVVTGEGRLDPTTAEGKVVARVAARAARSGLPVHAVVGQDALGAEARSEVGVASVREASTLAAIEGVARELAA